MNRSFLYYCLLLSHITIGFSQIRENDTILLQLKKEVEIAQVDSTKVNAYLALGNYYLTSSFLEAEEIYQQAITHLENSPSILQQQRANVYGQLGVIYKRRGEYPKAMEYYLKSKQFFETLKDSSNIANLVHNIAMIHRDQKEYKKAITSFKNVIQIKRNLGEKKGEAIAYNMLGVSYRRINQLDSAEIYYKKAEQLFLEENSLENIPRVNSNLAALYHYQKKYRQSIALHQKNIAYYTKKNKQTSLFSSYYNMAKTYSMLSDYKHAFIHIDKAISIAEKLELKDKLSKAYLRKSLLSSEIGKYKQALIYYKKYKNYADSIYNITNVKKLQALELTYKFKKQQQADSIKFVTEKRNLELIKDQEQTKKQLYFLLLITTILLGILANIGVKRYYKKKNKAVVANFEKKEKELHLFTEKLLQKIQSNEQEKEENTLTKKLHIRVAEKILTKEDWYSFKEKFNKAYPLFFKKIKERGINLTNSEERLVSLEKLGLDNNQIAKVLGISLDSVFVNRYRLRKKIKAPKEISIIEFLEEREVSR